MLKTGQDRLLARAAQKCIDVPAEICRAATVPERISHHD